MPSPIVLKRKDQRDLIIEKAIIDFQLHKPQKDLPKLRRDFILGWIIRVGTPIIGVLISLIIKLRFFNLFSESPYVFLFTPIIISSWFGGFYSGVFATLLGSFAATYFLIPHTGKHYISITEIIILLAHILEGIVVAYFIASQRASQRRAEELQLSFELLLDNTTDYGIVFFDKGGYITKINNGACRLTRYKSEEIQGQHFSLFFTPEDQEKKKPEKEYIAALKKGRSSNEDYIQKKNGTVFFASGFTTSLWTRNNQLYGFVKLFRDVTEQRRQDQEKEDFIGIAAHEMKNPVSSMNLYLQLLQKYYVIHPQKEPQNYMKKIAKELQRLMDLMTTLLDVSRIQKGRMLLDKEKVNINNLIDELIENMQSAEGQHQIIKKGHIPSNIHVDKRKLEEVLINLINNAIKYSPDQERIEISLLNKKVEIEVSVKDFGIGMPKEVAAKVFERFYRGSPKQTHNIEGLGIGLYIASQIIHAHGGTMSVESQPGKGSTFSFTIPKK